MTSNDVPNITRQALDLHIDDGVQHDSTHHGFEEEAPPPPPKIHSRGVLASDITRHFVTAAAELDTGQLIKDDFFTLFESVGAIELMDPKMDTGFLLEGETMEDHYDVARILQPEEILGVIDQMICLEVAWHMGHPLSQTVFTSLYIDWILNARPTNVDAVRFHKSDASEGLMQMQSVLEAYCLGLIKTCWHVNNRVKSEQFYEEEDFVTHTYNMSLLEEIEDSDIILALGRVKDYLSQGEHDDVEIRRALEDRIQFRLAFLKAVSMAEERTSISLEFIWEELAQCLPGLKSCHTSAKPVPISFSTKVQRKLASTVPPRPIITISFDEAHDFLCKLCRDGKTMVSVLEYHDSHSLITFVRLFQSSKPQPSVYIRTLLQYYIFGDMIVLGRMSIRTLLDDDLSALVLPGDQLLDRDNDEIELPQDPRFNIAQRMEVFRTRAAQSYLDVLRTLCQNRCRTRRTLYHALSDWDNLQLDAEELDVELRQFTQESPITEPSFSPDPMFSFPLSSWAYFYKLQQMEWLVQIGFELSVYQAHELGGMYWYLHHLAWTRSQHLERIRMFIQRRLPMSSKTSNKSSVPQRAKDDEVRKSLKFIEVLMLEAAAAHSFAEGLSVFFGVLSRFDLLPRPAFPYSDDATRYELRMKPFLTIGLPEFLPYTQFVAAAERPATSTRDLLDHAITVLGRAKKDFQILSKLDARTARCVGSQTAWKDDIMNCLKACITASVGIATLKKVMEKGMDDVKKLKAEVPVVEKGHHDWWRVPKISFC